MLDITGHRGRTNRRSTIASVPGRAVAAMLLALAALAPPVLADTWVLDRAHTNVTFSWNHLGISRQSARILDVEGTLEFDPAEPEKGTVAVTFRVQSISTGVEALDRHLRSADFFDAGRHPTITFKSTAARKTGDKTGEVVGELTILGQTRPVTLDVTWNFTGEHPLSSVNPTYRDKHVSGFSARTRLLRSEWGLARATPLVSDEIEVSIEAELFRK